MNQKSKEKELVRQMSENYKAESLSSAEPKWAVQHGLFTRVGETTEVLIPGLYTILVDQSNQVYFQLMTPKTNKLLRFPDSVNDTVLDEVQNFWSKREQFEKYGVSFRRGYLLYGPPGSGKSSILQLLAIDVIERGGIVLVFDNPGTFTMGYREVRRVQPDVPIVVFMEDLDAILETFKGRESNILNLLDGVEKLDRVIFVATTNYAQKLEPRITNRPSRFDKRYFVGPPNGVDRKLYLESLNLGDLDEQDIERYVEDTEGLSLAHVKELFTATVIMGQPYEAALRDLIELTKTDRLHSAYDDGKLEKLEKGRASQYI